MPRLKDTTRTVERVVGARLRERRMALGLRQRDVAERIGITYQQLHKYEQAINRISAGRLLRCAYELSVPIDFFFQGLSEEATQAQRPRNRMSLSFSRAFNEITEPHFQRALAELARVLAEPPA